MPELPRLPRMDEVVILRYFHGVAPMVAIESPSMEPHMERGDLVFLMEEHRFAGGAAHELELDVPEAILE